VKMPNKNKLAGKGSWQKNAEIFGLDCGEAIVVIAAVVKK